MTRYLSELFKERPAQFGLRGDEYFWNKEINPYVEQFAHGGMSSGRLNGTFWIEQGIPLIIQRYHEVL